MAALQPWILWPSAMQQRTSPERVWGARLPIQERQPVLRGRGYEWTLSRPRPQPVYIFDCHLCLLSGSLIAVPSQRLPLDATIRFFPLRSINFCRNQYRPIYNPAAGLDTRNHFRQYHPSVCFLTYRPWLAYYLSNFL
jgi:hypothetical protein